MPLKLGKSALGAIGNWIEGAVQWMTAIIFGILFVAATSAVFFGFIGYYSRVSLSSDLRQYKDGTSIDLLFMRVDQLEKDEVQLNELRKAQATLEENLTQQMNAVREKAYASPELAAYFDARAKLLQGLGEARSALTEDYWQKFSATLLRNSPDNYETEIALWSAPIFQQGTPDDVKNAFYGNLASLTEAISRSYRDYNAKYQQHLYLLDVQGQTYRQPIVTEIKAIFARSPQLATADDRKNFVDIEQTSPEARQQLSQQRAIIRSFDNLFVGEMRRILEWPTIASTLLVTLATGWLGGLVNFMGAAIRGRSERDTFESSTLTIGSLFRRSILGITAALGVFLAAGSGLLILTAQSSGTSGTGAIELSPYFVAFLAFISGFLADDAFSRLAAGGRKLFEIGEDGEKPDKDKSEVDDHSDAHGDQSLTSTPAPVASSGTKTDAVAETKSAAAQGHA